MECEGKRRVVMALGGAFNPVHTQHVEIMQVGKEYLEKHDPNLKVIAGYLAVATDGYLKSKIKHGLRLKAQHRINMCNASIGRFDWLKPVDRCYGSAFECATHLKPDDECEVAVIVGADRAFTRDGPKWRRSFKNPIITIIIGRPGETERVRDAWALDLQNGRVIDAPKYVIVDVDTLDVSSTKIRQQISFLSNHQTPIDQSNHHILNKLVDDRQLDKNVAQYLIDNYTKDLFF